MLNEKMLNLYDYFYRFEQEIAEEMYSLHFSICDITEAINENSLHADGYVLKYKIKE